VWFLSAVRGHQHVELYNGESETDTPVNRVWDALADIGNICAGSVVREHP
jgi:hypothetical protein